MKRRGFLQSLAAIGIVAPIAKHLPKEEITPVKEAKAYAVSEIRGFHANPFVIEDKATLSIDGKVIATIISVQGSYYERDFDHYLGTPRLTNSSAKFEIIDVNNPKLINAFNAGKIVEFKAKFGSTLLRADGFLEGIEKSGEAFDFCTTKVDFKVQGMFEIINA